MSEQEKLLTVIVLGTLLVIATLLIIGAIVKGVRNATTAQETMRRLDEIEIGEGLRPDGLDYFLDMGSFAGEEDIDRQKAAIMAGVSTDAEREAGSE